MACRSCNTSWNTNLNIPLELSCSHVLCKSCAGRFIKENQIKCPFCSQTTKVQIPLFYQETFDEYSARCIDSLPQRLDLIQISVKKRRAFEALEKCEDHPECPVVAYCERPFSKLCHECLVDIEDIRKHLKIIPYPEIVGIIRRKLADYRGICEQNLDYMVSNQALLQANMLNTELKEAMTKNFTALLGHTIKLKDKFYSDLSNSMQAQQKNLSDIFNYSKTQISNQRECILRIRQIHSSDDRLKINNMKNIQLLYSQSKSDITNYPKPTHIVALNLMPDEPYLRQILLNSFTAYENGLD